MKNVLQKGILIFIFIILVWYGPRMVANFIAGIKGTVAIAPLATELAKKNTWRLLIILQNNNERRATGGFWTGIGAIERNGLQIRMEKIQNVYDIDAKIASQPAPVPLKTYFPAVDGFHMRDANISPDLPTSMSLFDKLYALSPDARPYDGAILLDTHVLVDIIRVLDGVRAGGSLFTTQTIAECDCPQVLYELSALVGKPLGYERANRKAILTVLMRAIAKKIIFAPHIYAGHVINSLATSLDTQHILLYFKDKHLQTTARQLGATAELRPPAYGDFVILNQVNFGGQKSNLFVQEKVSVSTKGSHHTFTLELRNLYPHSDCDLESGGLCLNAPLPNWFRVYVPRGSILHDMRGPRQKAQPYEEFGMTVFEGLIKVNPLGSATVQIQYTVPTQIDTSAMTIIPQPGVQNQIWTIVVDGATILRNTALSSFWVRKF